MQHPSLFRLGTAAFDSRECAVGLIGLLFSFSAIYPKKKETTRLFLVHPCRKSREPSQKKKNNNKYILKV